MTPTISDAVGSRSLRAAGRRLTVAAALVGLSAACTGATGAIVAPTDIGHVHDLVVEGNTIMVATHRGLLGLTDGSYRTVGDEIHDLMAVTRGPSGDLLASGHPDMRLEKYRVDGAPSILGLASSSDDGGSWHILGWLGEADFHALVATANGFVGGDSTGSIWQFNTDGDGQAVGSIPFDINDLAVAPDDSDVIVAASYDGELAVSDDAGQTWELQLDSPPILEIEWTTDGLIGATTSGQLWTASEATGPFEPAGEAPAEVETLLVSDSGTWVATHGGQIHRRDADGSWTPLVRIDD